MIAGLAFFDLRPLWLLWLGYVPLCVFCVQVLDGVMFNKDVTHSKMRRRIENPRVLLLDCPLEYKKGEVSDMLTFIPSIPSRPSRREILL